MFKLVGQLIKLCLPLLILVLIFHDLLAERAIEFFLGQSLGVPVHIGKTRLSFLHTHIFCKDIRIGNPPGFGGEDMTRIRELFIDFEISSFWERFFHFSSVEIDIPRITVVRSPKGRVNLFLLKPMRKEPSEGDSISKVLKSARFNIDKLVISLDQARYVDLIGDRPRIQKVDLDMHRATFYGIQHVREILQIISMEALKRASLNQTGSLKRFL